MNEATKNLIAEIYMGKAGSEQFIDWAVSCLEQGIDSKNIRILASMGTSFYTYEIEDRFSCCLKDLGWEFPKTVETLFEYTKFIAKQILNGQIEPFKACLVIARIYDILDCPKGLFNWVYLTWGHDEWTNEQMNSAIFYEAENLASFEGTLSQLRVKEFAHPTVFKEEKEGLIDTLLRKFF